MRTFVLLAFWLSALAVPAWIIVVAIFDYPRVQVHSYLADLCSMLSALACAGWAAWLLWGQT